MQIIAGLSKTIYWAGNLIFDFAYGFVLVAIACFLICVLVDDDVLAPHIFALLGAFTLALLNCLLVTYFVINMNLSKELTDSITKWSLFVTGMAIGIYDAVYSFLHQPEPTPFALQESALVAGFEGPVDVKRFNPPLHFLSTVFSPVYNVSSSLFSLSLSLSFLRVFNFCFPPHLSRPSTPFFRCSISEL